MVISKHNNARELEQAQTYLVQAISKLNKIPQKSTLYSQAQTKINNYDSLSIQIKNKLISFEICQEPQPDRCRF